jgi:hypothetical protein
LLLALVQPDLEPHIEREAIRAFVCSAISTEFTIKDIRKAWPGVSDDLIRKVLCDLRGDGVGDSVTKGRAARYRRLRTDF